MPVDDLPKITKARAPLSCGEHIVYRIICNDGRAYIGVTSLKQTVEYSLRTRWIKHVSRAKCDSVNYNLCVAIRELGRDSFKIEPLHVVDTKQKAHDIERYLIDNLNPELNSDTRPQAKTPSIHIESILTGQTNTVTI